LAATALGTSVSPWQQSKLRHNNNKKNANYL